MAKKQKGNSLEDHTIHQEKLISDLPIVTIFDVQRNKDWTHHQDQK